MYNMLEFLGREYGLRVIQWWFEYPICFTKYLWKNYCGEHAGLDGIETFSGMKYQKKVSYGRLPQQTMDIMTPFDEIPIKGYVIYVHGGGFVCSTHEIYSHSLTFLVRQGFVVIGIDYPLAPQYRHPVPVLSVLLALQTISLMFPKANEASCGINLLGDSAGGNLVLLAAALIQNQHLLTLLAPEAKQITATSSSILPADNDDILTWTFPSIKRVVSVYGMLARQACSSSSSPELVKTLPFMNAIIRFLWQCHDRRCANGSVNQHNANIKQRLPASFVELLLLISSLSSSSSSSSSSAFSTSTPADPPNPKNTNNNRINILKNKKIKFNFPSLLLCCADKDFLTATSHQAKQLLNSAGGCFNPKRIPPCCTKCYPDSLLLHILCASSTFDDSFHTDFTLGMCVCVFPGHMAVTLRLYPGHHGFLGDSQ